MTVGKGSALAVAFVGAVALGVALGPTLRHSMASSSPIMDGQPAPDEPQSTQPTPQARHRATAARRAAVATPREVTVPAIAASEPKMQERIKPVLNRGTRVEMAADGFKSAEQFATVAHAARNTSVPFMVLKHRVLDEGRTLVDAIHESKPELDAKAEVTRARDQARSDVQAIAG